MKDPWKNTKGDIVAPSIGAIVVTPSDTQDLPHAIRAVTIGVTAGSIRYEFDGETWTTGTLPIGTYSLRATRILATGTTAAGMTGWV